MVGWDCFFRSKQSQNHAFHAESNEVDTKNLTEPLKYDKIDSITYESEKNMNTDSGLGSNSTPYEYTVSEQKGRSLLFKRIALITIYVLWAFAWVILGAALRIIAPLLAFIPLTLWMLIFFTWRYTQVEYEYSFFSGILTVSRVLGGRSRRTLTEVTLRDLESVCPCNDENAARIDGFLAEHTVFAASSAQSDGLYAAMWNDEESGKQILYFEPNEKALKIIRYYNVSALPRR